MIRCFVAVDINDSVRQHLRLLQQEMRRFDASLSYTDPGGTHVTLKFLSSIEEKVVARVRDSLSAAHPLPAFEFSVSGLGGFPRVESPRVFWAGVTPAEPLASLQRTVEEALAWMGIAESRPFHPHLTVARVKEGKGLVPLIDYIRMNQGSFNAGVVSVPGYHLYQSVPVPGGVRYVKLASFALS